MDPDYAWDSEDPKEGDKGQGKQDGKVEGDNED